jgi:hypothetical protein
VLRPECLHFEANILYPFLVLKSRSGVLPLLRHTSMCHTWTWLVGRHDDAVG